MIHKRQVWRDYNWTILTFPKRNKTILWNDDECTACKCPDYLPTGASFSVGNSSGSAIIDSNGNGVLDSTSTTDEAIRDSNLADTVIDILLFESASSKSVTTAFSGGDGSYSLYLAPDTYYVYSVYSSSETQETYALLDTITVTYGDDLTNSVNTISPSPTTTLSTSFNFDAS